jgi:type I restriction enzyme R subunit
MASEYNNSEKPAIDQLIGLGYEYQNAKDLKDERDNPSEVLLKNRLSRAIARLNPWMKEGTQQRATNKITSVQGSGLMTINKAVWELLKGGSYSLADEKGDFHYVNYIDFDTIENNDFLVVNQMRYRNSLGGISIPDLVIYVNGLPLVVIECKSPISKNYWDDAYKDLNFYQKNNEKLFHYNQICIGIWGSGGRYGAIAAPQKFYSKFRIKEKTTLNEQGILIENLLTKARLLDIMRYFIIFENSEGKILKKLPRYQQLRATNSAIEKLKTGEGGVVWHTQGSGKSITMAYLTRKLRAKESGFKNPTVLILTDRKDLDTQITNTFINVGFKNIYHADSVAGLVALLSNDYGSIITSTIQKFQEEREDGTTEAFDTKIDDLTTTTQTSANKDIRIKKIPIDGKLYQRTEVKIGKKWVIEKEEELEITELSQKENIYVLVDEAHRSQYGFLAAFMRTVIPKAKFVAFTGTPISKDEKSTLAEFDGGDYIDVYTIKESVQDGATVPLLYDEGIAMMTVKKEELDAKFEAEFGHESEEKRDVLKRAALKKYQHSKSRLTLISRHIIEHFRTKIRPNQHKAMLVCQGRPMAIRYQETFEALRAEGFHDFESRVVMSLGSPKQDDIAAKVYEDIEWNKQNPTKPQRPINVTLSEQVKTVTNDFKLPFGDENDTARSGKKQHDNTAFLIVSDMLLTGYDAPIASCLYLDKPLREHNLLQAIARVNRSKEGKQAGFIMDYHGIGEYLVEALEIFSGDLERNDIMKNLNEEIPRLDASHTKLLDFFRSIRIDRKYKRDEYIEAAVAFLEPADKRDAFKDLLKQFNDIISIILPDAAAYKLKSDALLFNEIKLHLSKDVEVIRATPEENAILQAMIDEHLQATGMQSLLEAPISITNKEEFEAAIQNASPESKELKIRNNLKHTIQVGMDKNPDFFRPLAERLERLIQDKMAGRLQQLDFMKGLYGIGDSIINGEEAIKNKGFGTERERVVFVSVKVLLEEEAEAVTMTKAIFGAIEAELSTVGWVKNGRRQASIEKGIRTILKTKMPYGVAKENASKILNLIIKNTSAYDI